MPATKSWSPAAIKEDQPPFLHLIVQIEEGRLGFGGLLGDWGDLLLHERLLDIVTRRIVVAARSIRMNLLLYRVSKWYFIIIKTNWSILEKGSLLSRLFRRSKRSQCQIHTFSAQFPPLEWFNSKAVHLHSVSTQTSTADKVRKSNAIMDETYPRFLYGIIEII